jgi:serine protease Do
MGWGAGAVALTAALLTVPSAPVSASDKGRVEIVRIGGGARLGVGLEDVKSEDLARLGLGDERGALVKDVEEGSPAEKAGLKEGDLILRYQGENVLSAAQLARLVRETPPGRKLSLEVNRKGAIEKLTATLAERKGRVQVGDNSFEFEMPDLPEIPPVPPAPGRAWDREHGRSFFFHDFFGDRPARLGIRYQELGDQLAQHFKVAEGAILVTSVDQEGPAAKAGVKAGDVIVGVDGKPIKDGSAFREQVSHLEPGAEARLTVKREGRSLDLKLTVGGKKPRREPASST